MSHSVVSYPQPGKGKALDVCRAFAEGCGGTVMERTPDRLAPGAACFYGVRPAWWHLFEQARAEGRDVYYIDNGFLGTGHYRVARNAIQKAGRPDPERLKRFDIRLAPWRKDGRHILVCLQSDEFLATFGRDIAAEIRAQTDRPVVIRRKYCERPLTDDLRGAWCVATWSSNAAVEGIIQGIPAVAFGESVCPPGTIESPPIFDRAPWLEGLAGGQWSLAEMRTGECWRAIA